MASDVVVVGPPRRLDRVRVVREDPPRSGPAAAVVAGLRELPHSDEILLLAVDVPRLPEAVAALRAIPMGPDGTVAVDRDGRLQWLLGRYRGDALREAAARFGDPIGRPLRALLVDLDLTTAELPAGVEADVDTVADAEAGRCGPARGGGAMSDDVDAALDAWWATLTAALGLGDVPVDRATILGLAGDAAHAIVRPAAPLTTFLAGYAAGLAGGSASDVSGAIERARRRHRGMTDTSVTARPSGHRPHGRSWQAARDAARTRFAPTRVVELELRGSVGSVLAEDAVAPRAVPHYDSSAMDGWAVAGPPPWSPTSDGRLRAGRAQQVVTGGLLPEGTEAVVPIERAELVDGRMDASRPEPGAHVRRAGEEASAGTILVTAGTRLSPAHLAVLAIAGIDAVSVRRPPRVGFVLTGDEVTTSGLPDPGRVRDAFDPLLPLAVERMGTAPMPPVRVGDDPVAIRAAIDGFDAADVIVTVGGTGRSPADRLREAIGDATTVFDGVAMRPGHPAFLAVLPDGRALLALPGNPLAAVAVLLSFLPPIVDALTAASSAPAPRLQVADALTGWLGGTMLVPCRATDRGLAAAPATRPNMLRGLAASSVIAVVPADGVEAGGTLEVLPLTW